MNNTSSSLLLFAVTLPPPTHGQSVMNKFLLTYLNKNSNLNLKAIDIGPGARSKKSVVYHLIRMLKVSAAIFEIIVSSGSFKKKKSYFVYESGYGVIYNFVLLFFSRLFGYKIYFHHHTARHLKVFNPIFSLLNNFIGTNSVHIVLSCNMRNDLNKLYDLKGDTVVLNNVVAYECISHDQISPFFNWVFGYISNISPDKGVLVAINAIKEIRSLFPYCKLIIAGPILDSDFQIEFECILYECKDFIQYIGPVYDDSKNKFFESISCLLFPSYYKFEAQPLVVIEAMSRGIPCITSSAGYILENMPNANFVCENLDDYSNLLRYSVTRWLNSNIYKNDCDVFRSNFLALKKQSLVEISSIAQMIVDE